MGSLEEDDVDDIPAVSLRSDEYHLFDKDEVCLIGASTPCLKFNRTIVLCGCPCLTFVCPFVDNGL